MARKKSRKNSKRRHLRKLPYVLLLVCLAVAALAVYCVYLDAQVRQKFENASWTLPAKVYAQPLQLYAGKNLSQNQLADILDRLGYRRDKTLGGPGSYRLTGSSVYLYSRPFTFWDGIQKAAKIRVRFSGGTVSGLANAQSSDNVALVRLDPLYIGSIYPARGADRILVRLDQVPPLLPAGLIAVEDHSFLQHHGISFRAIARAAWADLRAGAIVQGGSTLTQQLVKNLFLTNRQTISRKIKEALMAILLELHYSKEAILETYLNEVYLGQDGSRSIHGFGLGSYFYFRKPLKELEPQEIALLVAMVKGPSYYNPRRNPERAKQRRNLVLDLFFRAHLMTEQAVRKAKAAPLGVTDTPPSGTTQYPAFIELVRRQLHAQYPDDALTTQGLRIFTTLNPRVQATASKRVRSTLATIEKNRHIKDGTLQSAAVVTSVEGGRVLALIGGRNANFRGFNRALDAHRQIGSLIKPAVYLTALEQPGRYSVVTPLDDTRLAVKMPSGKTWTPENYAHVFHGHPPLYKALSHSYNVATARLALTLGIPDVIETLKKLGFPGNPAPLPSLALGAVAMSPFEVAQIYNTLAGGGYYTPLRAIKAVVTRAGQPLSRYPLQLKRVFDRQTVYLLNWILQRVTHKGTGHWAYNFLPQSLNVAGKTGTSSKLRDSWFAGFSGNRVAVVWVGRDDDKPGQLTGATGALQIWARIMDNINNRSFDPIKPAGVKTIPLVLGDEKDSGDQNTNSTDRLFSGWLGTTNCQLAVPVPFLEGYVPEDVQPCGSAADDQSGDDEGGWFKELF